jgi:hypothetical protein
MFAQNIWSEQQTYSSQAAPLPQFAPHQINSMATNLDTEEHKVK